MPLEPGTILGHYEIREPLGKGGMGEVYRAHDSRVNREVALKVSHAQFSERFTIEAKAIAQLNHPNICTLYDVGPNYLVMELVEGQTLAERIKEGPVPFDEAMKLLHQMSAALDAAHEKGVVHRDFKPANVKITPNGIVKVLDFGLAKVGPTTPTGQGNDSPTLTIGLTDAGMILGTAAYMSPEQARGRVVDRRADIWAFGVVVWEMLSGKRMFDGDNVTDVLASVVTRDPDLTVVPEQVRHLLKRCLNRDPQERLRDIGEARFLLGVGQASSLQPAFKPAPPRAWMATTILLAVASAVLGYVAYRHTSEEEPRVSKLSLLTPDKASMANAAALLAISPDGRRVAFAPQIDGQVALWVRDLDALSARQLPGTGGAQGPFWSPDSRWIGFFADGKLKKIDVTGGPALTLCDVVQARGGTWSPDGVIVYGVNLGGLFRVSAAGGIPTALTDRDLATGEASHRTPQFLPDGRRFLYTALSQDRQKTGIYVDSIDAKPGTKTSTEVLNANSNAVYVPSGHLLFMRERTLMAQPFDLVNAQTRGDAVPIAEQVDYQPGNALGQFSASANGVLVYTSGATAGGNVQLTWIDRNGRSTGIVGSPASIQWATISPDGATVAADRQDDAGLSDIWLHDLARGTASRLTFGPQSNNYPIWSADGARVAFLGGADNNPYQKAANGVGQAEALDKDPRSNRIADWSRDGRFLIEEVIEPKTNNDIWVIPQQGEKKPYAYLNTEYREMNAKLSPNGQWLAYVSDESKRFEIYVQTFPERGGKWQVSTGGGNFPVWSRDGRELYFISADRKMMAGEIQGSGAKFEAGIPKALFEARAFAQFDVSKDGRFLMQVPHEQAASNVPITVVQNWQAALKK